MIFKNIRQVPIVKELKLKKDYKFMYENFVFSTQHDLYLLLEEKDGKIDALKFAIFTGCAIEPRTERSGLTNTFKIINL